MATEVTPGIETTEHDIAQSSKVWGIVALVLGMLTTIGASVADGLGAETTAAIIVGAVVAVAGIAQRTLIELGYIKSRADVKAASALAEEYAAEPEMEDAR